MRSILPGPVPAMLALLALCGCAASKLELASVKDPGRVYRPAPLHVLIQERKGAETYLKGMDTVAAAVFREAGLPADIAYDGVLDLDAATPASLRAGGAVGYALVITIAQLSYVNQFADKLIFQTEMFDLSDGKKVWKCVGNMAGRMGFLPGAGHREYLKAMLDQAAADLAMRRPAI